MSARRWASSGSPFEATFGFARAVREACAMADRARKHGGPVAQPYALAAYLAWWDGDGKAATLAALAALDDDPETSLAIMVAAMAASGRYPAYLR